MTILALEFSSLERSVAVAREKNVLAEMVETNGGRGTNALGMAEKVLAEAKIEREEIQAIVIGLGPGSYTGIRAAISIAQGWQLAHEIKLIGISSVEAIASQAQAEKNFGRVNVIVDAQRNEFYLTIFEISEKGFREVAPLKIATFAEIQSLANTGEVFVGPEIVKWFPHGLTIFPRATILAKLAASRNNFIAGEKLEPIYLRETNFVKSSMAKSIF
jgi:tRNA threonylcarbamoyladenosine biosynthesis protein TsaB